MSSYKGIVVPPSLTKTAGGQDMYIPVDPIGGGGDVIPGNLQVGGNLAVDGSATIDGAVSCGSTLAVTGPTTMSDLTAAGNVILSTNPAANGLSIGTSVLPVGVGGLRVAGASILAAASITSLANLSLGASAPVPVAIGGLGTGWTVGVFSGWRVVVGSTPVSGSASPTNYSLLWSTIAGTVGTATPFSGRPNVYVQSSAGSNTFFSVNVNDTTGFSGQCINTGGSGVDGINGMYLAIGPA